MTSCILKASKKRMLSLGIILTLKQLLYFKRVHNLTNLKILQCRKRYSKRTLIIIIMNNYAGVVIK